MSEVQHVRFQIIYDEFEYVKIKDDLLGRYYAELIWEGWLTSNVYEYCNPYVSIIKIDLAEIEEDGCLTYTILMSKAILITGNTFEESTVMIHKPYCMFDKSMWKEPYPIPEPLREEILLLLAVNKL